MEYIFDIGLNIGQDTDYYLNLGYNVIAVDANPDIIEYANIKYEQEILDGRLILLEIGISDNIEILDFYKNKNNLFSSFDPKYGCMLEWEGGLDHIIKVETTTLSELINEYGTPYYIKIDIEGYDSLSLNTLTIDNKPKYISLEFSDIDIISKLQNLGYTKFKYIDQEINKTLGFIHGSSGFFGEDTIGEWLNYNDAVELIDYYSVIWCDVHATY